MSGETSLDKISCNFSDTPRCAFVPYHRAKTLRGPLSPGILGTVSATACSREPCGKAGLIGTSGVPALPTSLLAIFAVGLIAQRALAIPKILLPAMGMPTVAAIGTVAFKMSWVSPGSVDSSTNCSTPPYAPPKPKSKATAAFGLVRIKSKVSFAICLVIGAPAVKGAVRALVRAMAPNTPV